MKQIFLMSPFYFLPVVNFDKRHIQIRNNCEYQNEV